MEPLPEKRLTGWLYTHHHHPHCLWQLQTNLSTSWAGKPSPCLGGITGTQKYLPLSYYISWTWEAPCWSGLWQKHKRTWDSMGELICPAALAQDLGSTTFLELPAANPRILLGWLLEAWIWKSDGAAPLLQDSIGDGIKKQKGRNEECVYKVRWEDIAS